MFLSIIYLCIYLSVYLSICLSIYLYIHTYIHSYIHTCIHACIHMQTIADYMYSSAIENGLSVNLLYGNLNLVNDGKPSKIMENFRHVFNACCFSKTLPGDLFMFRLHILIDTMGGYLRPKKVIPEMSRRGVEQVRMRAVLFEEPLKLRRVAESTAAWLTTSKNMMLQNSQTTLIGGLWKTVVPQVSRNQ